jgi:hypothetical protein
MKRDGLHYWIEPLPGERGQLHADLVADDRIETSYPVGSPAPRAVIERAYPEAGRKALEEA